MRCLHCASDFNGSRKRGKELDHDKALDLCRQLADLGCEKVILSGGEAILREDWQVIAETLNKLDIATSLISNGYILNREIASAAKKLGLVRIGLSLDGLRRTHNHIRQNPKSFDRVINAARYVVEEGIPLNIVTHINRSNLSEMLEMEALVKSLGASVWRLQIGSPLGSMASHPELFIIPEELPDVVKFIVEAKRRWQIPISVGDNIGYYSKDEELLRSTPNRGGLNFWGGCSAGCLTMGIEADGNIKGCLSLQSDEFIEGNIRDVPLREIWNRPGAFAYTRNFKVENLKGHCRNCELGEICRGGCTFMAYGSTGVVHDNPYCMYGLQRKLSAEKHIQ